MTAARRSEKMKPISKESERESLKVLIVGGEEAIENSGQILDSLATMGFDLDFIGVVYQGSEDFPNRLDIDPHTPVFLDYVKPIQEQAPDLLIITSDDHALRKRLVQVIPPHTRILDSFALKALKTLKRVYGHLGTTRNRLQSVELIKDVLMAGSEVSIMVVDEDFKVLEINNAILNRTKMSRKGCIGRACHWVINRYMEPCYHRGDSCVLAEVLRNGRPWHGIREETREDGTSRYFTVSGYPLTEDERGKKCVLVIWKDVTRGMGPVLDRQARNIRENFSQFLHQDKMAALGKLAAAAVHEINNPVQGILTLAKLMRAAMDGETIPPGELNKFRTYLSLIATESARCGQIVRNLLSFSRQGNLQKSSFGLNALLEEIFLLLGNQMELQGITLNRQIDANLRPLFGDRDQIKQALLNLILNSVEAMPEGGVISVSADQHPDPGHVRIRISDTGGGVPKKVQGCMFEPFVTTKAEGKGVGLGLSVVYGVIAQHGGYIEVDSEEGQGATFTLTLPISNKNSGKEEVS